MIANNEIDDGDMGFMRWGVWWGINNDVIYEYPGHFRVYLASGSDYMMDSGQRLPPYLRSVPATSAG